MSNKSFLNVKQKCIRILHYLPIKKFCITMKGKTKMLKSILKYCKLTFKASPLFCIINLIALISISLAQLGTRLAFKYAADTIISVQNTGVFGINIALPILFFFLMICIGGNTDNFNKMLTTLYTNKAKKIFYQYFIYKSYKEKQDSFYDSEFYDNYTFTKNNIENTTKVSITIFNNLTSAIINLVISSIAISVFSPIILIFILILSVVMIFINKYVVNKRVELNEQYINDERKAKYYSELLSDKKHSKELRIYGLKDRFLKTWSETYKIFSKEKYDFEKKAVIITDIPNILEQIFSAVYALYFLYLVSINQLTVGEFTFLNGMLWSLTGGITAIINIISRDLTEGYKYVDKYERFAGSIHKKNIDEISDYKLNNFTLPYGEFKEIELDDITYSYPNQKGNAVDHVSLKIKSGEIVCLLGYNGSGKSTLSKLICGFLEDYYGTIKLNGINVKEMPRQDLYRYFGIGFQDFTKYSLSLKENVGFGMIEKYSDETELAKAMEKGKLNEIISRLPYGADTIIGKEFDSSGQELSGGQWQRVTLSRAYMGEPEFLILDEPTASVDPIEEMRMLNHFKEIINDKTALLISHRIGFARLSNRICVMENGVIVEDGTHSELMSLKGYYYELFTSQQNLYSKSDEKPYVTEALSYVK